MSITNNHESHYVTVLDNPQVQLILPSGHDYPGLSLIFIGGGDLHKITGIRVAVVNSTGWHYIDKSSP